MVSPGPHPAALCSLFALLIAGTSARPALGLGWFSTSVRFPSVLLGVPVLCLPGLAGRALLQRLLLLGRRCHCDRLHDLLLSHGCSRCSRSRLLEIWGYEIEGENGELEGGALSSPLVGSPVSRPLVLLLGNTIVQATGATNCRYLAFTAVPCPIRAQALASSRTEL